jgi:methionyl-tRNA synthetase
VIAATPTSNGDLHVGHIAGPYLAGDVYARYLRATGRPVIYTTCTDDNQSYVVSTARRKGVTPQELIDTSTAAIARTMNAVGLSMSGLPPIDDLYQDTVVAFVTSLYEAGRLRLRTVRFPYATRAQMYLYDGLVSGTCPVCLSGSSGGACEACGHPNNFDELLDARSTMDPTDPVESREATILVLPLEHYRDRLTAYYHARRGLWRPRAMQLIEALLARPLPDVPVTVPSTWGTPAPFADTRGQRIYPWIEAMPASIYATWWSARCNGDDLATTDQLWRADSDTELVFFHGYDNVFHWGLLDIVLLMAHGDRYLTPTSGVCNEFYDLDGEKFSTSRNHLIWAADLVAEVPRDLVRFYLALSAPEYQRTNFSVAQMREVLARVLVGPWNTIAEAIHTAARSHGPDDELPTSAAARSRCMRMAERMRPAYELSTFSLRHAAETIAAHLSRLAIRSASVGDDPRALGDLLVELRTVLAWSVPILIDVADRAAAAGIGTDLEAEAPHVVTVFELPRLAADLTGPMSYPAAVGAAV